MNKKSEEDKNLWNHLKKKNPDLQNECEDNDDKKSECQYYFCALVKTEKIFLLPLSSLDESPRIFLSPLIASHS